MTFGLGERDVEQIRNALKSFPEIVRALIFGSRALGSSKRGSDVDIAIVGERTSDATVIRLRQRLNEELPLPYFFDVVRYETIANGELKEQIDTHGVVFFAASETEHDL